MLKVDAVSPSEILLTFSEAVDLESAENSIIIMNYYRAWAILMRPVRLLDPAQVHLFFDLEMENGMDIYAEYLIRLKTWQVMHRAWSSVPVLYYPIMPYDLVFTEIMADPIPSTGPS
ncbi:MAG: hypothetical protein MZV49_05055 [Rhodopseudomonas palustris]|nr:hypothetical protein [Rhodopseudomonas palustris]